MNPFPRDHRTIVNNGGEKRPNGWHCCFTVETGCEPCHRRTYQTTVRTTSPVSHRPRPVSVIVKIFGPADTCQVSTLNTFRLINVRRRKTLICSDLCSVDRNESNIVDVCREIPTGG